MNDAELVRQAWHGDAVAFESPCARWSKRLVPYCEKRGIPRDLAEELTRESMGRAHRSLSKFSNLANIGTWATEIALRVDRDWRKRRLRPSDATW